MSKFPPRPNSGQEGISNFLKIKDGDNITGILRGELHSFYETGFGATRKIVGPDEGGKARFRHNFVVHEEGKYVAKVWEFGAKIYDTLTALEANGWDLENTLITVSRQGSTKENTKYTVSPLKKEPTAAALKEINKLSLNILEHKPQQQEELAPEQPTGWDSGDEVHEEIPF